LRKKGTELPEAGVNISFDNWNHDHVESVELLAFGTLDKVMLVLHGV